MVILTVAFLLTGAEERVHNISVLAMEWEVQGLSSFAGMVPHVRHLESLDPTPLLYQPLSPH